MTLVYVYVFINIETRVTYAKMFEEVFRVLGEVSREPVRWAYLDSTSTGIRTVGVDMCKKQAPGIEPAFVQHIIACTNN